MSNKVFTGNKVYEHLSNWAKGILLDSARVSRSTLNFSDDLHYYRDFAGGTWKVWGTDATHSLQDAVYTVPARTKGELATLLEGLVSIRLDYPPLEVEWVIVQVGGILLTLRWHYSLDGGTTWIAVGTAILDVDDTNLRTINWDLDNVNIPLASITNDIRVRISAQFTGYSAANLMNAYTDDLESRIILNTEGV